MLRKYSDINTPLTSYVLTGVMIGKNSIKLRRSLLATSTPSSRAESLVSCLGSTGTLTDDGDANQERHGDMVIRSFTE